MSYAATPVYRAAAPAAAPPPPPKVYYSADGVGFYSAAEAANRNALIGQRNAAVSGIQTGEGQAFSDASTTFQNQANPFLNDARASQTSINQGMEDASLNRLSSIHSLLDTIRQGIQSFGIGLANRNASDSGASEAGAKAYARQGEKGYGQIQQGFTLDTRNLKTKQDNLNASTGETGRQLHGFISDSINRISNDTQMRLEQLGADAAYAGLSPVDVAGIRSNIITGGQAKLQALDSWLSNQMGTIKPESADSAEQTAAKLFAAGTPAPGSYDFSIASPNWSGAPISQTAPLPIFTGRRDTQPAVI
jgi:hypothetical protein